MLPYDLKDQTTGAGGIKFTGLAKVVEYTSTQWKERSHWLTSNGHSASERCFIYGDFALNINPLSQKQDK